MSFSQFFVANWLLFALLFVVLAAIVVYESRSRVTGGRTLSNIAASSFINNGARLIDVRPVAAFKKGHIAGAKNVPAEKFADFAQELKNKEEIIVLYCQSGDGVQAQARLLISMGFANVYTLKSGVDGWAAENLPLV